MARRIAKCLVVLMLAACVTPTEWAATPLAGVRRRAIANLERCFEEPPFYPMNRAACIEENKEWCINQGAESSCGIDGTFGNISDHHR